MRGQEDWQLTYLHGLPRFPSPEILMRFSVGTSPPKSFEHAQTWQRNDKCKKLSKTSENMDFLRLESFRESIIANYRSITEQIHFNVAVDMVRWELRFESLHKFNLF